MRRPARLPPSLAIPAICLMVTGGSAVAQEGIEQYAAPPGAGFGTPERCFQSLEIATRRIVVQEPFEAAQVLYAARPVCEYILPEVSASLALTDVVLREPERARGTLRTLAAQPETARWARILGAALDAAADRLDRARQTFRALAQEFPDDQRVLLALAVVEARDRSAIGREALIDLARLGHSPLSREWRVLPVEDVAIEMLVEAARRVGVPDRELAATRARFLSALADRLDIDHTRALREEALRLVDEALVGAPADAESWLAKRDLVARLDGDTAGICDAMEAASVRTADVVKCRGRDAYERRDVDAMCQAWRTLRNYRPQDPEAKVGEAVCRWWTSGAYPPPEDPAHPDGANPNSPLSVLRGYGMLAAKDVREAVDFLRAKAQAAPGDLVLLRALSVALRKSGDNANFEALAGFTAQSSDSDNQSIILRGMAARRRARYVEAVALVDKGDAEGARRAIGDPVAGDEMDLLDRFARLRIAVVGGDRAGTDRQARELQDGLRRVNARFFGGLQEEWEKGRQELKRDAKQPPMAGMMGGGAPGAAATAPAVAADAVSKLLGLEERRIIQAPGGRPPGMADVPPAMKDMPANMVQQYMEQMKAMGGGAAGAMPPMAGMDMPEGFGALPPGAAAMMSGPEAARATRPTPASEPGRRRALEKERILEFDMKIDRPGQEPRR